MADREHLPAKNAWNEALRNAIPKAFEKAVERFNGIGTSLRYSWPGFLEHISCRDPFWDALSTRLIKHLQSLPILECRSGSGCFRMPQTLFFVPPEYRLDGEPLIDSPRQRERHLAFQYAPDSTLPSALRSLGVKLMDNDQFISQFCDWIAQEKPDLDAKSPKWHSKTAAILVESNYTKQSMLQSLPIVPTLDGNWVPASKKNLYLASNADARGAPHGLDFHFVNPEAKDDPNRAHLFSWLGIEKLKAKKICERILEDHRERNQSQNPRPQKCLIEDAFYLFLNKRPGPREKKLNLWVATANQNRPAHSRNVYIIDPDIRPNLISKYSSNRGSFLKLLHPEYFEYANNMSAANNDADAEEVAAESRDADGAAVVDKQPQKQKNAFAEWLKNSCEVATLPRLTFWDHQVNKDVLSKEWSWLRANAVDDLIILLRDHLMNDYSAAKSLIIGEVKEFMLNCQDERVRKLQDVAIPTKDLCDACPHLAIAKLPDPENKNWKCFSIFSVITEVNDEAYLRELEIICQLQVTNSTLETARRAYLYLSKNSAKVKPGTW